VWDLLGRAGVDVAVTCLLKLGLSSESRFDFGVNHSKVTFPSDWIKLPRNDCESSDRLAPVKSRVRLRDRDIGRDFVGVRENINQAEFDGVFSRQKTAGKRKLAQQRKRRIRSNVCPWPHLIQVLSVDHLTSLVPNA
jgi:hypothetical protein